jgi:predicted nucleotidyltransferase
MSIDADINRLLEKLRVSLPDLIAVYLFGSQARDAGRPGSDIDLAVLRPEPLDAVACWNLAQELAALAGKDVDLIDLRGTSTVMRARIVAEGLRLYCANDTVCAEFEDHAFSAYARLNEERREILQDIRKRGYVAHGG